MLWDQLLECNFNIAYSHVFIYNESYLNVYHGNGSDQQPGVQAHLQITFGTLHELSLTFARISMMECGRYISISV